MIPNNLLRRAFLDIKYKWASTQATASIPEKIPTENHNKKNPHEGPTFIAAYAGGGICRAALITSTGRFIKLAERLSHTYEHGVFGEMSSDSIWECLVQCIKIVTEKAKIENIRGITFTGTSALVCVDNEGQPVTVSTKRNPRINIILNHDMRSIMEAKQINETRHSVLQYYGDIVLPSFQESKLMWLKSHLYEECWKKTAHFFDLTDFLTWKTTGSLVRSSSTLSSHWSYRISVTGEEGWSSDFFDEIGIPEVNENKFRSIGAKVQRPGIPFENGLLESIAAELGLQPNLTVATSMPGDMAGCLSLLACNAEGLCEDFTKRLCIVFGARSGSHFILSEKPKFTKGVHGPLKDAIMPNYWMSRAGQTRADSVLDQIISGHPATAQVLKQIGHMHIHKYLNKILKIRATKANLESRSYLTRHIHVLPDFDGNKSPFADPQIRGMISGLSTDQGQQSLALLYLAGMQSLAYGTRHILNTLTEHGHDIQCIVMGGALGKNSLFAMLHKDVCQVPTIIPKRPTSILLGAAILAAVASNTYPTLYHAIQQMSEPGKALHPDLNPHLSEYHARKFEVFLKMYKNQYQYRQIMEGSKEYE